MMDRVIPSLPRGAFGVGRGDWPSKGGQLTLTGGVVAANFHPRLPETRPVRGILLALVVALATAGPLAADPPAATRPAVIELAERLKAGLRVQVPRDTAFCDLVAQRVHEGRLPGKVVDSTYLWAVSRGRKYPFPAFEQALRIKAAKLNVPL